MRGSNSSLSPPPPSSTPTKRLSLRSISSLKRGPAPSSFIDTPTEASSSYIPSRSPEDLALSLTRTHTTVDDQPSSTLSRAVSRESSFAAHRISIVSLPRPNLGRRPSSSSGSSAPNIFNGKSLGKRIALGWSVSFGGPLPPTPYAAKLEYQRVRPVQVTIANRPASERRHSTASDYSTASIHSEPSCTTSSSAPSINKPFANRRISHATSRPAPEELPTVEEESDPQAIEIEEEEEDVEDYDEEDQFDEMGLARSLTRRLQRNDTNSFFRRESKVQRQRPQISLPQLVSTTNSQVDECVAIHPALRPDTTSYIPQPPRTPASEARTSYSFDVETPGLTDSSSVGSRSSSSGSPIEGMSVNHLTQYFTENHNITTSDVLVISEPAKELVAPPAIPMRAPSHSKREHVRLARTRSLRSSVGYSHSAGSSRQTSLDSTKETTFATELAKLDEVHEDFNSLLIEEESPADDKVMQMGYNRFTPSCYLEDLADMEALRWA